MSIACTRRGFLEKCALGFVAAGQIHADPDGSETELENIFENPPAWAKPWMYWAWLKGTLDRDSIARELESFHRAGVGGIVLTNAALGPALDEPVVKFGSPEWRAILASTLAECERLGLKMILASGDGWSHSGGYWIPLEKAMQRVVHSELRLKGPSQFQGVVPHPWQNEFYEDVAVTAFRTPPGDHWTMNALRPALSTNGAASGPLERLLDGDPETGVQLSSPPAGQPLWLRIDFEQPVKAGAIRCCAVRPTAVGGRNVNPHSDIVLEAADHSGQFRGVISVPPVLAIDNLRGVDVWGWKTATFQPLESRIWRLVFRNPVELREVTLIAGARIERWEDKSGQTSDFILAGDATPAVSPDVTLDPDATVDLSGHMDKLGRLVWNVPEGEWTVLRFGRTWTGGMARNPSGASQERSPEVDKLDPAAVGFHYRAYIGDLLKDLRKYAGRSFAGVEMDSWEVGSANWTPAIGKEFRQRRGYDLRPWLPALAGWIVGDAERSDRFLFDFRRTLSELLADGIFSHYRSLLEPDGLRLWAEALGPFVQPGRTQFHAVGDSLQAKGRVDVPMAEFWTHPPLFGEPAFDTKEAASAAHVYGKPVAAAEAFTAMRTVDWLDHPAMLKALGDLEFSLGINLFVIHTSVHQPFPDRRPGATLSRWGIHFLSGNTWDSYAGAWLRYLARCQAMLRQGKFVADILYYLGEDSPIRLWDGTLRPSPPAGYDYDACTIEALLERVRVEGGRLVLPDGMSYALLVVSDARRMTPPALRKIKELVSGGATILVNGRPESSPSLADYPRCDDVVRRLAAELWGGLDGRTVREHRVGAGRMIWRDSVHEALGEAGIPQDFGIASGHDNARLVHIHRRREDAEIYFVSNQRNRTEEVECAFRAAGRQPEIWDPLTGEHRDAPDFRGAGLHTIVPLKFAPAQSYFVIFRRRIEAGKSGTKGLRNFAGLEEAGELAGPWTVRFDPKWGGPERVTFEHLGDWTQRPEDGIKFYSGTARYQKTFDLPEALRGARRRVYLDLGDVKIIARVRLNGKDLGEVWTAPWRVEISAAVKPTANELEIEVANLWANRLVRDLALPESERLTWTTNNPYDIDTLLAESGLIGPVTIQATHSSPAFGSP